VRTLVTSQIQGSIDMRDRAEEEAPGDGTSGTVAELRVPVTSDLADDF
jgi:hypothetical protein